VQYEHAQDNSGGGGDGGQKITENRIYTFPKILHMTKLRI
jgi:hypothetical protein